jgi:hypothetical protein
MSRYSVPDPSSRTSRSTGTAHGFTSVTVAVGRTSTLGFEGVTERAASTVRVAESRTDTVSVTDRFPLVATTLTSPTAVNAIRVRPSASVRHDCP